MLLAGIVLGVVAIVRARASVGLLSHQLTIPLSAAVFIPIGGLVLARQPRHPVGWILAGLGCASGIEMLSIGLLAFASLQAPGQLIRAPGIAHWLVQWIWMPRAWIPLTFLLLLFPDGRLPSGRWWLVAAAAATGIVGASIKAAFSPNQWEGIGGIVRNPFALDWPGWPAVEIATSVLLLMSFAACLVSVFVRFHKSAGVERQQLKWMVYAVCVVVVLSVVGGSVLVSQSGARLAAEIAYSLVNLSVALTAGAVGIAVLRYRLYDIDVLIRRTLVYSVLTAVVVGLYVVVVGALGAVFQTRGSLLVSLMATGLIAILFQPLRDRLQRTVNRLLYGHRDEPYSVLSRIGRSLEGAEAPGAMASVIVDTIAETLKLPYVGITVPEGQREGVVAENGRRPNDPLALSMTYQGRQVGRLLLSPREAGEPFTEVELRLLHDIANQTAVVVHAFTLSAALQRSRERLVSTREEERRRLRRDLHDGLGPRLAGLALKLDAARNQLSQDTQLADAILLQSRGDLQEAIAEVRRLIYNLRPPALDELGLLAALRETTVAQFPTDGPEVLIEGPPGLPVLPAAVEVAAYRVALEAVTNVARHANANRCTVRFELDDGLTLEVRDDGDGLPPNLRPGVGLESMRERTAELGGWLRIEKVPQGGTRLIARFPLTAERR